MYTDADIEMAEITAASNLISQVTDDVIGSTLLHPKTVNDLADVAATALWFGDSGSEALALELRDRGFVLSSKLFDTIMLTAAGIYSRWENEGVRS